LRDLSSISSCSTHADGEEKEKGSAKKKRRKRKRKEKKKRGGKNKSSSSFSVLPLFLGGRKTWGGIRKREGEKGKEGMRRRLPFLLSSLASEKREGEKKRKNADHFRSHFHVD